MMPQLLTLRIRRPDHRPFRIWVPVLPVLLVLSPLVVVATLVTIVACIAYGVSVMSALAAGWRLFSASSGTRVDIEQGRTAVLVTIR